MMTAFPYTLDDPPPGRLGLIVLQVDETIERDFRGLLPPETELCVTRVPLGRKVSTGALAEMEGHLTEAARLLPGRFAATGYACTSGSAVIGPGRVADLVRAGVDSTHVTDPLTALVVACQDLGVARLALLSPYVAPVSARLRDRLTEAGVATPVFGSFDEAEEAKVARITSGSIISAASELCAGAEVDALFLSCTNLRTLDVITSLEAALNRPVLSSNLVLAWHMCRTAGIDPSPGAPGRLFTKYRL